MTSSYNYPVSRPHPGLYSYYLGIMNINQYVNKIVLGEFQKSPIFKGMAINRVSSFSLWVI